MVDATVSIPALVNGLFRQLPDGEHELVVFDINREGGIGQVIRNDPMDSVELLEKNRNRSYALSVVSNENTKSQRVVLFHFPPGEETSTDTALPMFWPEEVYSLSHVALPFPSSDPLYGIHPNNKNPGLLLGDMALRGERGVLQISASELLRLRWNPFYPYLEERLMQFIGLD